MSDKPQTTKCECQRASWSETTRLKIADNQVKIWSNTYSLCPSPASLKVLIGYLEEYATAWTETKCHD